MLLTIIVALVRTRNAVIIRILADRGIVHLVAITVIAHKCNHISLIMADENRCRMLVVRREMIPMPRREPRPISRYNQMRKNQRRNVIDRLYDVCRSVDIRSTYDLYPCGTYPRNLGNQSGDVLIDVMVEDGLDEEHVIVPLDGLKHAEIIHIPVPIEVQIGNHIRRVVQQVLELLDSG